MLMWPSGVPQETSAPAESSPRPLIFWESTPKIPRGVTISGIAVGGLTEQKALEKVQAHLPSHPEANTLDITYQGEHLSLAPEETGVRWNIEKAVEKALSGVSQELTVSFQQDIVRQKIKTFFEPYGGIYAPSGCWTEGERPDLEAETGAMQILVINPGSSGLLIDLEDILDQITEAYQTDHSVIEIPDAGEPKNVRPLDLDEIYRQVSVDPINPDIDRKTLEILPGKRGYGFIPDQVRALMDNAAPGGAIRIPMQYLEPTLSEEEVWFQDALGYCKTPITDNENRNENLRLACSMLNGKILQPGETISYNETLGKRTAAAGYKPAPAYSGTELVDEIGGGICQVSSTLYLSSLFAELNIVERRNHGFPANYIPLGLDATVNWGTTDLKIRNDYKLPVKILAEVSDGYVKVKIMGVEQRDYYVKMEYRVDDHPSYAAAYRCRYDRQTDEQIFRNLNHTSIYLEEVWCWPGYAENASDTD